MLLKKVAHQCANFQTCHCFHPNSPNSSCHFWNQESVFLQTLHHSSVMRHNSPVLFLNLCMDKRIQSSKRKFSDFRLLAWKWTKFFVSFFKPKVSFTLNFEPTFSVMTQFLWNFLTERLYALDKKSRSVYSFFDFWVL